MPNLSFKSSVMGYNKTEVDEYISNLEKRVMAQVDELIRENASLKARHEELSQATDSQAEILSGEARRVSDLNEILNKEKMRADQFESMYTSVTERYELLEADIRRMRAEKEQSEKIIELLQGQIYGLKEDNEKLLEEIRQYEKQRALVAELELKAFKRAKELEYDAEITFEKARADLKKNLEIAENSFNNFRQQVSRLSSQTVAELDTMKDRLTYIDTAVNEAGERFYDMKNYTEGVIFKREDGTPLPDPLPEQPPAPVELPKIINFVHPSAAQEHDAMEDTEPKQADTEAVVPEPAPPVPLKVVRLEPAVSLIHADIINPFDDHETNVMSEASESEFSPADSTEQPDELFEESELDLPEIELPEAEESDFDSFFSSYLKKDTSANSEPVVPAQDNRTEAAHERAPSPSERPDNDHPRTGSLRETSPLFDSLPRPTTNQAQWYDYGGSPSNIIF